MGSRYNLRALMPFTFTTCAAVMLAAGLADETFETDTIGTFAQGPWLDLSAFPDPNPATSSKVVATTDALGAATNALAFPDALELTTGIYLPVPQSGRYRISAHVRIDRYSDGAISETAEWPVAVGITQLEPGPDAYASGGVQVYASSFTQEWRLFVAPADRVLSADIPLGLPAVIGTWYAIDLDVDAITGTFKTTITDIATSAVLLDRTDVMKGWTPALDTLNALVVLDGENLDNGVPFSTIPNLAVVDNITYELGFDSPCAPEPLQGDLDGDNDVDAGDLAISGRFRLSCG